MPFLNYSMLRRKENSVYRFSGGFDSIAEDDVIWVESFAGEDRLTVPVSLKNAQTYMLPITDNTVSNSENKPHNDIVLDNSMPMIQNMRWNKISTLTTGAKVFIGGLMCNVNGRKIFCSTKSKKLIIIFYECSFDTLNNAVLCAGRTKSGYFNPLTPYSLSAGIFFMLYIVQNYYTRPAYRLTVLGAILAMFSPLFPALPPGIIFTYLHTRARAAANLLRITSDAAKQNYDVCLPQSSEYQLTKNNSTKALLFETLAWSLLAAAIAVNLFFAVMIIFALRLL
ncbi:MAG: hypothetical protein Ta2B_03670 [Termitinemataceae bacterium]|nr:MAG: hypothetical protein Ta2B_03670 [Termitinemataceae bacterium]